MLALYLLILFYKEDAYSLLMNLHPPTTVTLCLIIRPPHVVAKLEIQNIMGVNFHGNIVLEDIALDVESLCCGMDLVLRIAFGFAGEKVERRCPAVIS